jgi:hypothetical protein
VGLDVGWTNERNCADYWHAAIFESDFYGGLDCMDNCDLFGMQNAFSSLFRKVEKTRTTTKVCNK